MRNVLVPLLTGSPDHIPYTYLHSDIRNGIVRRNLYRPYLRITPKGYG